MPEIKILHNFFGDSDTKMMHNFNIQDLIDLQPKTEQIRNICIIAHVDHGKTTLSDCLIASNGIISTKNAGTIRYLDYTPEEQERGITMKSSAITLLFQSATCPSGRLRTCTACRSNKLPDCRLQGTATSASTSSQSSQHSSLRHTEMNSPKVEAPPEHVHTSSERTYLINLLDSPGHVDFTSEVCSALRVSDGAILVVDVIEGVCIQTRAVLRAAWRERLKVVLVLNKLDKLIDTLQLDPFAAWLHIRKVLESVNQLVGSLQAEDEFKSLELSHTATTHRESDDEDILHDEDTTSTSPVGPQKESDTGANEADAYFSPKRGNVVFASAMHGWGFRIDHFADIYAKRLGIRRSLLMQTLWGEYYLHPKTRKVHTKAPVANAVPMFVQFVLKNIWDIYSAVSTRDQTKMEKIVSTLSLSVPPRELRSDDNKVVVQAILGRWLPISRAVLEMVVEQIPDPRAAQQWRIPQLWTPPRFEMTPEQRAAMKRLKQGMLRCDPAADTVAFVSKVFAVDNDALLDATTTTLSVSRSSGHTLIALARLFSGTLHRGDTVHVLGPKYSPATPDAYRTLLTLHSLYLIMGRILVPIDSVPAGNVFGIALSDVNTTASLATSTSPTPSSEQESQAPVIVKTATLSSTPLCASFDAMRLEAAPIIRVAVEPESASDYPSLVRGMRLLHLADPGVQTYVDIAGEFIVCALGEVHLQHCLKELREKYARIPLRVSPPLVSFRETVVDAPSRVHARAVVATETDTVCPDVSDGDDIQHIDEDDKRATRSSERMAETERSDSRGSSSSRERHRREMQSAEGRDGEEDSDATHPPAKRSKEKKLATVSTSRRKKKNISKGEKILPKEIRDKKIDFVVHVTTSNKRLTVSVQCRPLPPAITSFLDTNSERIRRLVERQLLLSSLLTLPSGATPAPTSSTLTSDSVALKCDKVTRNFRDALKNVFAQAGPEWEREFDLVWAFGPHHVGPNVLLNHIAGYCTSCWWRPLTAIESTPNTAVAENDQPTAESCHCFFRKLRELNQSFVNGFQLATQAGPLCEEPMMGVCFAVENVVLHGDCHEYPDCTGRRVSSNVAALSSTSQDAVPTHEEVMRHTLPAVVACANSASSTSSIVSSEPAEISRGTRDASEQQQHDSAALFKGQVISAMKDACRQAVTRRSQRLMEAYYLCDLLLDGPDAYGKAHAVLAKRRAKILSEEVHQGSYMYHLRAHLPAVESFGFAEELFSKTSGACQTQMMFSHWALLDEDPDFVPVTEEEVAELGDLQSAPHNLARRYVDTVRKRKGLPVKEKLVEAANKQRNLSKNK